MTIRVASLLDVEPASTHAAADKCAFYPALFGLVCDVLDDAGAAIYDRIKTEREFDERRARASRRFRDDSIAATSGRTPRRRV